MSSGGLFLILFASVYVMREIDRYLVYGWIRAGSFYIFLVPRGNIFRMKVLLKIENN